jgi:hypothetical protein
MVPPKPATLEHSLAGGGATGLPTESERTEHRITDKKCQCEVGYDREKIVKDLECLCGACASLQIFYYLLSVVTDLRLVVTDPAAHSNRAWLQAFRL